ARACPAVTAVGPTLRHVLLTPEAERSVAAPPGLHVDAGPVVENERLVRYGDEPAPPGRPEAPGPGALGEDRVVAADARARTRAEARATLAHDDRPRANALAV